MRSKTGFLAGVIVLLLLVSGCQSAAGISPWAKVVSVGAAGKMPLPSALEDAANIGLRFHVKQSPEEVTAWYRQQLPKSGWQAVEGPALPWEALFYRSSQDGMTLQIRIRSTEVPGQSLLEFLPNQEVLTRFFAEPGIKDLPPVAQFPHASGEAPCTITMGSLSLPGNCATAIMPRAADPNGQYMSPIKGPQSKGFAVSLGWQGKDWRTAAPSSSVVSQSWTFELDDDGHILSNRTEGPLAGPASR
jgi:hypothetical protein